MKSLVIIGTVHLDPNGHSALLKLLHELQADAVSVEVSPFGLEFRRTKGRKLLERLEPFRKSDGSLPRPMHAVVAQIRPPFEYTASEAYTQRSEAKLLALGDNQLSRQLLARLERELMVTDNLVNLATRDEQPLSVQVEREWSRARHDMEHGPILDSFANRRLERMDIRMARLIRGMTEHYSSVVHVGGWEHLKGLGQFLADLEPEVRLLKES